MDAKNVIPFAPAESTQSDVALIETAVGYHRLGFIPIPEIDLRPELEIRKPAITNWQKKVWPSEETLRKGFRRAIDAPQVANGIGILLGQASGGLIDVDIDNPIAVNLAPIFLPPTRIFGRASNPSSHWIYIDPELTADRQQKIHYKVVELELRCGAHSQAKTTFPGSINHGELVTWQNPTVEICQTKYGVLKNRFDQLSAATLIAMHWVEGGHRQDISVALSGSLARSIYADIQAGVIDGEEGQHFIDDWDRILRHIAEMQGDRSMSKRCWPAKAYRDLQESMRMLENGDSSGPRIQGVSSLAKCFEREEVSLLVNWLGLKESVRVDAGQGGSSIWDGSDDDRLAAFDREHAVVNAGSKARIIFEIDGALELWAIKDCTEYFSNLPPIEILVGNNLRATPFFQHWLKRRETVRYEKIVFEPSGVETPNKFNLWRGWPIAPTAGDCSLYLAHIHDNIADGDEKTFRWVIAWMADAIQNPTRRTGTALALRGEQGIGKGVFVNHFLKLFGSAGTQIGDAQRLTSRFNSKLANRLMVFADESFWAGDKKHEGLLKSIITESSIDIEYKGIDSITVPNYIRLIMATNNEWVAPAGIGERRFCVLDVPEHRKGDHKYFSAINRQMNDGGYEALMHYLLTEVNLEAEKADGIDPAVILTNQALTEQKILSAGSTDRWLLDMLHMGYPSYFDPVTKSFVQLAEGDKQPKQLLRDIVYHEWCKKHAGRNPDPISTFGKKVTAAGFIEKHKRVNGQKIPCYVLPTLTELRVRLAKQFGTLPYAQMNLDDENEDSDQDPAF